MSHRSGHDSLSSITTDAVTGGLQQKQNYDHYHHVHQLPPLLDDKPEQMNTDSRQTSGTSARTPQSFFVGTPSGPHCMPNLSSE